MALGLHSPSLLGRCFFEPSRIILLLFQAFLLSDVGFFEVYVLTVSYKLPYAYTAPQKKY